MSEFKKVNLTSSDVISDTAKSLADLIFEARKTALKEEIRANTVLIDKTFAKVNDIHFLCGRDILHIPPMICGLEVRLTDELPDGYDFALVEAPETERERIVRQAKSEAIDDFVKRLLDAFPECNRDNRCPAIYYDDYREIIEQLAEKMKGGEE